MSIFSEIFGRPNFHKPPPPPPPPSPRPGMSEISKPPPSPFAGRPLYTAPNRIICHIGHMIKADNLISIKVRSADSNLVGIYASI